MPRKKVTTGRRSSFFGIFKDFLVKWKYLQNEKNEKSHPTLGTNPHAWCP
jgi:hypothetical protein